MVLAPSHCSLHDRLARAFARTSGPLRFRRDLVDASRSVDRRHRQNRERVQLRRKNMAHGLAVLGAVHLRCLDRAQPALHLDGNSSLFGVTQWVEKKFQPTEIQSSNPAKPGYLPSCLCRLIRLAELTFISRSGHRPAHNRSEEHTSELQ